MKAVRLYACALAIFLAPTAAIGQQRSIDTAYVERRLSALQQQLANLNARIEQIREQDLQLQQQLEAMRTKWEARIGRLEKGGSRSGRR
jgi:TolA-binding protein